MMLLTDAQRTVTLADVHVLGTATGTWWDHITNTPNTTPNFFSFFAEVFSFLKRDCC